VSKPQTTVRPLNAHTQQQSQIEYTPESVPRCEHASWNDTCILQEDGCIVPWHQPCLPSTTTPRSGLGRGSRSRSRGRVHKHHEQTNKQQAKQSKASRHNTNGAEKVSQFQKKASPASQQQQTTNPSGKRRRVALVLLLIVKRKETPNVPMLSHAYQKASVQSQPVDVI
jgi:hypothetical protein